MRFFNKVQFFSRVTNYLWCVLVRVVEARAMPAEIDAIPTTVQYKHSLQHDHGGQNIAFDQTNSITKKSNHHLTLQPNF